MAHEIEDKHVFVVGDPAWHNITQPLPQSPTIDQARGIVYPWDLIPVDITARIGDADMPMNNHYALFRSDGKELGIFPKTRELVQPAQLFEFFAPFLESELLEFESGASLFDGRMMFLQAKIKNSAKEIIKNDTVEQYLLLSAGFDGTHAIEARNCATRVVCNNTLQLACAETDRVHWMTKHTKNVHVRLERIQEMVAKALFSADKSAEVYQHLATKHISDRQASAYFKEFLDKKDVAYDDMPTRTRQTLDDLLARYEKPQYEYQEISEARGTAWRAYNTVTEYLTHDYNRSEVTVTADKARKKAENRFVSLNYGPNAQKSQKMLDLALAM